MLPYILLHFNKLHSLQYDKFLLHSIFVSRDLNISCLIYSILYNEGKKAFSLSGPRQYPYTVRTAFHFFSWLLISEEITSKFPQPVI